MNMMADDFFKKWNTNDIHPAGSKEMTDLVHQYEQSLYYIVKHFNIASERGDFKLYISDKEGNTSLMMYISTYAILDNPVMVDMAKNVYIASIYIDTDERENSCNSKIIALSGIYCAEKHTDSRYANYLHNKIREEYERLKNESSSTPFNEEVVERTDEG